MATLEKIRSKSVLLVVIIAVALLAFILGDAITNGRNLFGNTTTVAKVGKDKIEIPDYQRKQQELSHQMEEARRQNPEQYANFDTQILSQQALEELIDEMLADQAVANTGIQVTPEMLRFFMLENPQTVIPEMQQLLQNMKEMGIPVQSPSDAHMVIFQPQTVGLSERQVAPLQQAWLALENRYSKLIGQMVYMQLLEGTFQANDLDVAAMKRDYVATANVKVAKKPYGNIDEKKYKVSDAEIQKAYNERKEQYKVLEPTKEVSFIAVNVAPSGKDVEKAELLAATVVKELKAGKGLSADTKKTGVDARRHEIRLSDVKIPALKEFVSSAAQDTVRILQSNSNGFLIAKMGSRSSDVDSIQMSSIQVRGNKEYVTKVLEYANSGQALDSLNTLFKDSAMYMAPQWVPLYTADGKAPRAFSESLYDSLYNSNGRYIVVSEAADGAVLATVNKKGSPKEIVTFETVEYEIHPSDVTLADARQKLEKFLAANKTASSFVKNARAAGYSPVDVSLNASTPAVPKTYGGFYPESRGVVRWVVMDSKVGDVSKIYQSKDPASPALYVAAVIDSYDEYVPVSNKKVREELTAQIRRDKAGDDMVKQYSKGTFEASAQAMQVEPVEVAALQSSKPDATVTDSKVKGRIMGSKPGKMQVVKGDDGVYAFIINSVGNETVEMTDEQFAQMFQQLHRRDHSRILRGNKKIENNIFKFEAAD